MALPVGTLPQPMSLGKSAPGNSVYAPSFVLPGSVTYAVAGMTIDGGDADSLACSSAMRHSNSAHSGTGKGSSACSATSGDTGVAVAIDSIVGRALMEDMRSRVPGTCSPLAGPLLLPYPAAVLLAAVLYHLQHMPQ